MRTATIRVVTVGDLNSVEGDVHPFDLADNEYIVHAERGGSGHRIEVFIAGTFFDDEPNPFTPYDPLIDVDPLGQG